MKKRGISLLLAAVLAVSMGIAGCGGSSSESASSTSSAASEVKESSGTSEVKESSGTAESTETGDVTVVSGIEPKHFMITGGYNENHAWNNDVQTGLDLLTEISDGAYTYDFYNGGTLVAFGSELDALNEGTSDIVTSLNVIGDSRFHYHEVVTLPVISFDSKIVARAAYMMQRSDKEIQDGKTFSELEFGDKDIIGFYYTGSEPYNICTAKGGPQLNSIADVTTNLRYRTASRVTNLFAEDFGVTPITMTMYEVYDAMSRGALDGVVLSPDWENLGITELIENVYDLNIGSYVNCFAMKKDTWESLDPEFREIFAKEMEERICDSSTMIDWAEVNWERLEEEGGHRVSYDDLDADIRALYEETIVKTWMDWIDQMEKEGYGGKNIALLWRDCLVECGGVLPDEIMALE